MKREREKERKKTELGEHTREDERHRSETRKSPLTDTRRRRGGGSQNFPPLSSRLQAGTIAHPPLLEYLVLN